MNPIFDLFIDIFYFFHKLLTLTYPASFKTDLRLIPYNKVGDEMKKIQIFSISLGFLIVFLLGFGANVLIF